jgi:hypothetical protein
MKTAPPSAPAAQQTDDPVFRRLLLMVGRSFRRVERDPARPLTRIQAVSIALFFSSASAAPWALMASPSPLRLTADCAEGRLRRNHGVLSAISMMRLARNRLRRERFWCLREVAAKTLQERPGIIERIANRTCFAKFKRQRSFNHDAPDMLSVPERTDAQKGPVMKWIAGPVALRQRLDHLEARPATVGSRATVL